MRVLRLATERRLRTLGRSMPNSLAWLLIRSQEVRSRVDGLEERAAAIKQDALETTKLPIRVFDTTLPFLELLMLAAGSRRFWKEQRTAELLSPITTGMGKEKDGMHAQAFLAARDAIRVA